MIKMNVFVSCLSDELFNRETMLRKKENPAFASRPHLRGGDRCVGDRHATVSSRRLVMTRMSLYAFTTAARALPEGATGSVKSSIHRIK